MGVCISLSFSPLSSKQLTAERAEGACYIFILPVTHTSYYNNKLIVFLRSSSSSTYHPPPTTACMTLPRHSSILQPPAPTFPIFHSIPAVYPSSATAPTTSTSWPVLPPPRDVTTAVANDHRFNLCGIHTHKYARLKTGVLISTLLMLL